MLEARSDVVDLSLAASTPETGYRWYALSALTLIYCCHAFDRSIMAILVEPLRAEFLLSDKQLGMVTGLAYAVAFSAACVPVGILADRTNRRNLLALIVFLWSCTTAVAGFATSYAALLLARMGVGVAESGASPISLSLIGDFFPQRERATAVGVLMFGGGTGAALAAMAGGYIAATYGWRMTCFFAGIPGVLLAILVLATLNEPRRKSADVASQVFTVSETVEFILARRSLVHLMVASPLASAATASMSAWLASMLMRTHGLNIRQAGDTMAVFGLFSAVGSMSGGLLSDRLSAGSGSRRVNLAALFVGLMIPVMVGAMLLASTGLAIFFSLVVGLLSVAIYPICFGSILNLVKPRMRGLTFGSVQVMSILIGIGMGPFLVGLISDLIGGPNSLRYALLLVNCIAYGWSCLHFLLARRGLLADLDRAG